jgi:hypothetical protein
MVATVYGKIEPCYVSTADTREDGVVAFRCIYFQPPFEKPRYKVLQIVSHGNRYSSIFSEYKDSGKIVGEQALIAHVL